MNDKKTTKAIVLKRLNYADSDRIITVLTPEFGKLSLMARGVRKIKSKMAGGIELFSVIDVGFISGRGEVGRLISARLDEHYGNIIHDINRVQLGYEILKTFDRNVEDNVESGYFYLLCQLLRLLNEDSVSLTMLEIYFKSQLLALAGHTPNLATDQENKQLEEKSKYNFDISSMMLSSSSSGRFTASHIKLLRLIFSQIEAQKVFGVMLNNHEDTDLKPVVDAMFRAHLSV
ncbi:MAG: DNA repair protein RecO [Candidatus Saccharibacteria bacterium]